MDVNALFVRVLSAHVFNAMIQYHQMKNTKRVFCKDCKLLYHATETVPNGELGYRNLKVPSCKIAVIDYHPIHGEVRTPSNPKVLNRNFNCPHYTPMNAERIRSGNSSDETTILKRCVVWMMTELKPGLGPKPVLVVLCILAAYTLMCEAWPVLEILVGTKAVHN